MRALLPVSDSGVRAGSIMDATESQPASSRFVVGDSL
jgi:hypothetical protein